MSFTYQNYVEQFEIFVDQISRGGILVYNEEDLVETRQKRQQNQPVN
jgi:UDP-N-acetylmuramate: L-alanyl-gamma-D-glutamyl-meso-diaminopimelate ligase